MKTADSITIEIINAIEPLKIIHAKYKAERFVNVGIESVKRLLLDNAESVNNKIIEYAEQFKPKPINVNDILPENETTDVLFYNAGYKLWFIGRLYDRVEKTFWDQSADTHTLVSHWMPLPEIPLP